MAQTSKTVLGPASYFLGQLKSDEDIHVDGIIEGPVVTSGNLTIGTGAEVRGPASATDVVLDGMVIGDVLARGLLTIGPAGRLVGDIRAAGLRIHDGGSFTGHVEMIGESGALPPVTREGDVLLPEHPTDSDDPADVTDEGPPAWNSDQHLAAEASVRVESSTLDPPEPGVVRSQERRPIVEIGIETSDLLDGDEEDEDDTEDPDQFDAPPIHETDDLPELLLPGRRRPPKPPTRPRVPRKRNS